MVTSAECIRDESLLPLESRTSETGVRRSKTFFVYSFFFSVLSKYQHRLAADLGTSILIHYKKYSC